MLQDRLWSLVLHLNEISLPSNKKLKIYFRLSFQSLRRVFVENSLFASNFRPVGCMKTGSLGGRESVSNTQLDTVNHGSEGIAARPESGEGAARAALDLRAGRTLTDEDWVVAKDRLLEFFAILRGWDRRTRTVSRDLVMCEVPCLREL